jgi:flagellar P-ring protein precursor FlgI
MFRCLMMLFVLATGAFGSEPQVRTSKLRDIATVEGIRDNPLIGYGLVVGLNGTGDRRQTIFTTQMLGNIMQRMGMQVPAANIRVNNIAAVFVTATLPPFARPGTQLDITVSSIGDAKSLEGGLLLMTPLRAADGQIYAEAQGALTLGGYTAGPSGTSKQVNHPTVARIPAGGLVERSGSLDLQGMALVPILLREPDFVVARNLAESINRELGVTAANVIDARRIEIDLRATKLASVPALMARLEELPVTVTTRARVVVNERTGTIVLGRDVRLGAVSIMHGNLSIEVTTVMDVSQPQPFSQGTTTVTPQTSVRAQEAPARRMELTEGATVEQLVNGLQSIGATARDVIAILQAMKAAGALQADLEVL